VGTIGGNVLLEPPVTEIAQCPSLEMEVCDERRWHMDGDECGIYETNAGESELRMNIDECVFLEMKVGDDSILLMDDDDCVPFESEQQMDVDVCAIVDVNVDDERGLPMDVDVCSFLELEVSDERGVCMVTEECGLSEMDVLGVSDERDVELYGESMFVESDDCDTEAECEDSNTEGRDGTEVQLDVLTR
jgi:hypothetical protein